MEKNNWKNKWNISIILVRECKTHGLNKWKTKKLLKIYEAWDFLCLTQVLLIK
jgi:hypothetical protein